MLGALVDPQCPNPAVFTGSRLLENPSLLPEFSHKFVLAVPLVQQYLGTTRVRLTLFIIPWTSCRRRPLVYMTL